MIRPPPAARRPRRAAPLALAALAPLLAACLPTAAPTPLLRAADPTLRAPPPAYAAVTAGVQRFEVTGPGDWLQKNRDVGPGGVGGPPAGAAH